MPSPDTAYVARECSVVTGKPPAPHVSRALGILALALLILAAGIVVLLDLTATTGQPVSRSTISAYVFTHPVVFTTAVFALVVASIAVVVALVRRGWIRPLGPSSWFLGLWILGMVAVAIFPKHNWVDGPSLSGHIHRVASLVAFFALPIAVGIISARAWRSGGSAYGRFATFAAACALAVLGYLVYSFIAMRWTGVPWWVAVDLGTVERLLVGLEVTALAFLALWAIRGDRTPITR